MTVTSTSSSISYVGDGVVDEFPTGFRFLADADLEVSVDGVPLSEGSDYVVTGAGNDAGGDVTLIAGPLASGSEISITRTVPLLQTTSLRTQGSFSPRLHEDALDRLTMLVQQVSRDVGLAIQDLDTRLAEIEAGVITTEEAAEIHAWQETNGPAMVATAEWRTKVGPAVEPSNNVAINYAFDAGESATFITELDGAEKGTRFLAELHSTSPGFWPAGLVMTCMLHNWDQVGITVSNVSDGPITLNVVLRVVGLSQAILPDTSG